jgi:hypothetical protein
MDKYYEMSYLLVVLKAHLSFKKNHLFSYIFSSFPLPIKMVYKPLRLTTPLNYSYSSSPIRIWFRLTIFFVVVNMSLVSLTQGVSY